MSIHSEVLATGGYISNHESDLYIEVNDVNREIIKRNLPSSWMGMITSFQNQVTGKLCYDIPFAFDPYWK